MMSSHEEVEFSLKQNAIDSLEKSIELLVWKNEDSEGRRIKQAILSSCHGIELLLKTRLRLIHPSLVWENVDKYPSLSARTVNIDTAISRLINIGGVRIANEDICLIRELRNKRNAIEHFSWSTNISEASSLVGSALGFAVHFSKIELGYEFFGYHTKDDDTFSQLMASNASFSAGYERRNRKVENENSITLNKCEFCNGIGVESETGLCRLCGHITWITNDTWHNSEQPF